MSNLDGSGSRNVGELVFDVGKLVVPGAVALAGGREFRGNIEEFLRNFVDWLVARCERGIAQ